LRDCPDIRGLPEWRGGGGGPTQGEGDGITHSRRRGLRKKLVGDGEHRRSRADDTLHQDRRSSSRRGRSSYRAKRAGRNRVRRSLAVTGLQCPLRLRQSRPRHKPTTAPFRSRRAKGRAKSASALSRIGRTVRRLVLGTGCESPFYLGIVRGDSDEAVSSIIGKRAGGRRAPLNSTWEEHCQG